MKRRMTQVVQILYWYLNYIMFKYTFFDFKGQEPYHLSLVMQVLTRRHTPQAAQLFAMVYFTHTHAYSMKSKSKLEPQPCKLSATKQ